MELSWTAPGSDGGHAITGYDIYMATYPTLSNRSLVGTVGASMRTYKVTDLNDGTTYFFVVQALTLAGMSPSSNEAYAVPSTPSPPPTVPTTTPTSNPSPPPSQLARAPTAPTGLTAIPTSTHGVVNLTWKAPGTEGSSPVTTFDIYWGTSKSGLPVVQEASVPSTMMSYQVPGLTRGVQYVFGITAANSSGQSAKSTFATAELALPKYQKTESSLSSTTEPT